MTDREKLIEMINHVSEGHFENLMQPGGTEALADHLLAHGVTVREPQKSLTLEELGKSQRDFIWIEHSTKYIVPIQILYVGAGLVEYVQFSETGICYAETDAYGKTWRCWAEKPTEEERKAAEWVK